MTACGTDARPEGNAGDGGAAAATSCASGADGGSDIDVGEVRLRVFCEGSGPMAVLLHGYPEYHGTWSKVGAQLVAAGYRVVMPDLRGHGLSDRPAEDEEYGIDHLVADVTGLIEAASRGPVLLVAHDWGGIVAFVAAHRRPDLVSKLVVMNAPHPDIWIRPEVDPVQAEASEAYVPAIVSGAIGPEQVEGILAPHLSQEELDGYRAAWSQPGARVAMAAWYAANVYPENRMPTGVTIGVPTLVLHGEADPFVTASELDLLPPFIEKLEILRLPDAGHWLPHEAPNRVATEIARFDTQ
jgi:pimeloyl-ACP methyl ester carboxylesterase